MTALSKTEQAARGSKRTRKAKEAPVIDTSAPVDVTADDVANASDAQIDAMLGISSAPATEPAADEAPVTPATEPAADAPAAPAKLTGAEAKAARLARKAAEAEAKKAEQPAPAAPKPATAKATPEDLARFGIGQPVKVTAGKHAGLTGVVLSRYTDNAAGRSLLAITLDESCTFGRGIVCVSPLDTEATGAAPERAPRAPRDPNAPRRPRAARSVTLADLVAYVKAATAEQLDALTLEIEAARAALASAPAAPAADGADTSAAAANTTDEA